MLAQRFRWILLLIAVMTLLAGCGLGPFPTVQRQHPRATSASPTSMVDANVTPTPEGQHPGTMTPTRKSAGTFEQTPAAEKTPTPRTPTITPIKLPTSIADICLERATFGDPAASPYILPYPVGQVYLVSQSYCNRRGSHLNQLAYDFDIPIGDDIIAARAGRVVLLWEGTPDSGDSVYGSENNYLFIRHSDGTVAMYAHLKQYSIDVEVGDYVEQGQRIAAGGNSGTGGNPHLHFGVYATWPNIEGIDLPVNFSNAEGPLDTRGGLEPGQRYKALPFD